MTRKHFAATKSFAQHGAEANRVGCALKLNSDRSSRGNDARRVVRELWDAFPSESAGAVNKNANDREMQEATHDLLSAFERLS